MNTNGFDNSLTNVSYINSDGNVNIWINTTDTSLYDLNPDTYVINIGNATYKQEFQQGGVYAVLAIAKNYSNFVSTYIKYASCNSTINTNMIKHCKT